MEYTKKLFRNVFLMVTALIALQCISVVKAAESGVVEKYKIGRLKLPGQ